MAGRPTLVCFVLLCGALLAGCRQGGRPPEPYTISVPYELDSFDPHEKNRLSDFSILSHFYEPLVATDAALALKPALAERWTNPDLLTWVFHLRRGVTFSDGRPLTAEDVVYSVERLLADRSLEMSGYVTTIGRVRALGPLLVEVRTQAPLAILLNKLRFVLVVPKGSTRASLGAKVVGTGPYRLQERRPGEVVMARNERHWAGPPHLAEVTFRLSRGPRAALDDLLSGRSALVQTNDKASLTALTGRPGVEVRRGASISVKYLAFDAFREVSPWVESPRNPFHDPRVRRAVDLAIDRNLLVERLPVPARPASQPVPPSIFGFNPEVKVTRPDQEAARRLLAEAGYPDGFALTFHTRSLFADAARLVAAMLAEVRIRARVVALSDAAYFATVGKGEAALALSRYGCPTGDASDILDNMLHTYDPVKGYGRQGDTGYSNAAVDRLIEESAGVLDMGRRRRLLQQIMARIMADSVLAPLYVDEDLYAFRSGVEWVPRADNFLFAWEVRPHG